MSAGGGNTVDVARGGSGLTDTDRSDGWVAADAARPADSDVTVDKLTTVVVVGFCALADGTTDGATVDDTAGGP